LIGKDDGADHSKHFKPKRKLNPIYITIPTIFDIAETLCSNIALTLIAASITQMLRATLIIFTAGFSVWILKMKLYRHHYISLVLILIGLTSVGLSQVFFPNENE
jgi:drug/metabolite transporter (DMT)-like permease